MLSKKFMDILSIIFIIFVIGLFYFSFTLRNSTANEIVKNGLADNSSLDSIVNSLSNNSTYKVSNYLMIFSEILVLIYWIFVLMLELQFYKKELVSIFDVIFVALLIPFAIFFYFISIRGKYKKLAPSN